MEDVRFSSAQIRGFPSCSKVVQCEISDVLPAGSSPRSAALDAAHMQKLCESEAALPPIVVHRETMRVVDGWHRLHAAKLRGETTIAAVFFNGTFEEAFVLAVKLNSAHGLPLSLADRKAAADRILSWYPDWSDRSIAAVAGISHTTVAAIRSRSTGKSGQSTGRIARNGVVYRSKVPQGRRRAAELFVADPGASARKVAQAAGISTTTAKDVRKRLRAGEDPAASRGGAGGDASAGEHAGKLPVPRQRTVGTAEMLDRLRRDPSLRFTDFGRKLLHWLESPLGDHIDWDAVVSRLPSHCTRSIAEIARQRSKDWQQLAELIDRDLDVTG
ncbi:streptomycin biosynthesis protein [Amycolatopsis sp. A1MSW2902]|uniref:ParB/RepB/Spo0J family partition protein n=1 Tax=Amycolatopsis sp. A1MSW2902 TaxID=687413 RepID=UPI00307E6112